MKVWLKTGKGVNTVEDRIRIQTDSVNQSARPNFIKYSLILGLSKQLHTQSGGY